MRAVFVGKDPGLCEAAAAITALGERADFWAAIRAHGAFAFSTIAPDAIVSRLQAETRPIRVLLWQPRPERAGDYRNTVAVTNPDEPFVLHYHVAFLGNSVGQKINTIVHEFIHNVDDHDYDPGEQMGHGDNDWHGKEESAPYWIGGLAQRLWETDHPTVAPAIAPAAPVEAKVFEDECCEDYAVEGSADPEV